MEWLYNIIDNEWDSAYAMAQQTLNGEPTELKEYEAYFVDATNHIRRHDFEAAFFAYNKSYDLAVKDNDSIILSYINYRLAVAYYQFGKPLVSDSLFSAAYEIAASTDEKLAQIYALNGSGLTASELGEFNRSLSYFEKGIPIAREINDKVNEWALEYGKMECFSKMELISMGYETGLRTLEIAKEQNDTTLIAKSSMAIAIILTKNKEYDEAITYFQFAYDAFKRKKNLYWCGIVAVNMAKVYTDLKNFDAALVSCREAQSVFDSLPILPQMMSVNNNMGAIYLRTGKIDSALYNYRKNVELADGNKVGSIVTTYNGLAKCYLEIKQYNKVIENSLLGLEAMPDGEAASEKLQLYEMLALSYDKLGNTRKAFEYSELKFLALKESRDLQEAKKITELETKYHYEKEKAILESEKILQKQESDRQLSARELQINIGLFVIVLILIILFLIFRMYQIKKKDNSLLQSSNNEIKYQAEQLKAMDSIKSRFFTNISHEFRTPLTLIKGPVDQLEKEDLNPKNKKLLTTIKRNANRLLILINQILELSELQSENKALKLGKVNLNSFTKRVVGAFESLAESRNMELTCECDSESSIVVIDEEAIEKILINLISNAFKFTVDKGRIAVHSEIRNGWLILVVKDTGIGIEEKELENIFEMFYHTESDQSASSGIGLALINELIKNHQGKIDVQSQKNEGTEFTIEIPATEEFYRQSNVVYEWQDEQVIKTNDDWIDEMVTTTEGVNSTEESDKSTILLVEDNKEIREYMSAILENKYSVLKAENGKVGVEMASQMIPDLIVSDIMMPEMDGFEAARLIKADEKTSHIPMILLTAKGDKDSKMEGLSLEIDDYLVKPFDQDELLQRINNLISNRKLLQNKFSNGMLKSPEALNIPSIDQQFVDRVRKIIEERLDDHELSVDELAREVGVSRSQLHRKIVALSGKSTSVFIRNIRLKKAYHLIEAKTGTVSEISDQVGFSSPSYFNKCFKELFGVTPKHVMNGGVPKSEGA